MGVLSVNGLGLRTALRKVTKLHKVVIGVAFAESLEENARRAVQPPRM